MSNPTTPPTAVLETLERLSSKAGVVAALAMDRLSSTVLASTGNLQTLNVTSASSTSVSNTPPAVTGPVTNNLHASIHESSATPSGSSVSAPSASATSATKPFDRTFDFASRIWQYVNFSGGLIQDMDSEDELKLLRLRTRKHEFMIVPDAKYIFVVVHEVSS